MLRDYALFLREAVRQHRTTGAVWPSSRALARAIVRLVPFGQRPLRVVEVGPGTGVFTQELVRRMGPHDDLVLIELSDSFARRLEERIGTEWAGRRVHLVRCPVEEYAAEANFDYAISGLPLNNFEAPLVRLLLRRLRGLVRPGGGLSFFEYLGLRRARLALAWGRERQRLRQIHAAVEAWDRRFAVAHDWVLRNLPPALVRHWRFES